MKNYKIFIVAGSLCLGAACGSSGPANTTVNTAAVTNSNSKITAASPAASVSPADELAMGRSLYEQNCAKCHKDDGTGGKATIEGKTIKAENLTEDKFKKADDAKIAKYIHDGVEDEGMPAFKDKLTEAQIREVVKYVRVGLQKMPETQASPASATTPAANK